jgi:hypothetical protein
MTFKERSASRSAFALGSMGYLRPFLPTSALTSSHEWNPVAPFTASRSSSESRRSSIISLIAASTTKLCRNPRRLQTATRASKRSAGTLVASVRVFTEYPFYAQSCQIPCGLSVEDYTMPELLLHSDTAEPLGSCLKALDVLLLFAEKANLGAHGTWRSGALGFSPVAV